MKKLFLLLTTLFFIAPLLQAMEFSPEQAQEEYSVKIAKKEDANAQPRNYGLPASLFEICINVILSNPNLGLSVINKALEENKIPSDCYESILKYTNQLKETKKYLKL